MPDRSANSQKEASIRRAIIFADFGKPKVVEVVSGVTPWLAERLDMVVCDLSSRDEVDASQADIAVVFGGDGAILCAGRSLGHNQIPVVGVNMGKFGFLAEIPNQEIKPAFERILSGDFRILERMMLSCQVLRDGQTLLQSLALNDAVVSRSALSRLIEIDLVIDNVSVTTYNADGLIVSTPVGSTAHSLSAGGPIVSPELDAFIVTPICPHTLTNRPIVEPADRCIEMVVRSSAENVGLTLDGQVYVDLDREDRVTVRRASQRLRLISTGARGFHETLRDKLHWGGHPEYAKS